MIERELVVNRAAEIKAKINSRVKSIIENSDLIVKAKTGLNRDVTPERLMTLENVNEFLVDKQNDDIIIFATLRWVLGITEDIDVKNLDLDK